MPLTLIRHLPLPRPVWGRLKYKGVFTATAPTGERFRLRSEGGRLENKIFWKGLAAAWEPESLNLWASLCGKASTIFDVGANIGIFSLLAQAANPRAKVVGFEPVPELVRKFALNVEANCFPVWCEPVALSNTDGEAEIQMKPGKMNSASLRGYKVKAYDSFRVPTLRLDTYCAREGFAPDLLKIDVEGFEPEVLEGMGSLLEARPTVLIEILTDELAERIERVLPAGYRFYSVDESHGLVAVPTLALHRKTGREGGWSKVTQSRNFLLTVRGL